MRLAVRKVNLAKSDQRHRILCGDDVVGMVEWQGRGSYLLEAFGKEWGTRQLGAIERARMLEQDARPLIVDGTLAGRFSSHRAKDGLIGTCSWYELATDSDSIAAFPNPGGKRGWRMSVHECDDAGEPVQQIALVKRPSDLNHALGGFEVVAPDERCAAVGLLMAVYDAYTSYLENDGGAPVHVNFRMVNIFGKRAQELDDPLFEARCEGELPEEEAETTPESVLDRAARLARETGDGGLFHFPK